MEPDEESKEAFADNVIVDPEAAEAVGSPEREDIDIDGAVCAEQSFLPALPTSSGAASSGSQAQAASESIITTVAHEIGAASASGTAPPPQDLQPLLQRIRDGYVISDGEESRHEADMLLRFREHVPSGIIPTRRVANAIKAPPCIFFVLPSNMPLPNQPGEVNETEWMHRQGPGGDGGSLKDSKHVSDPYHSAFDASGFEGVLKMTGTLKDESRLPVHASPKHTRCGYLAVALNAINS